MTWMRVVFVFLSVILNTKTLAQETPLIPLHREVITPENISRIEQLTVIGRGFAGEVAWSPDGQALAVTSSVGVWLYDADDWSAEPRLLAEFDRIREFSEGSFGPFVEFSPDGTILAFSAGVNVRRWDMVQDRELAPLTELPVVESIAFSPDGSLFLASGDSTLVFWRDWQVEKTWRSEDITFFNITFSPDGTLFATSGNESGNILLWKPNEETLETSLIRNFGSGYQIVSSITFHPDGKLLAASDLYGLETYFYDLSTFESVALIEAPSNVVAYSPDGRVLATGNSNAAGGISYFTLDNLNVFDVATGEELMDSNQDFNIRYLAFSPDNSMLVTVMKGWSGVVRVFDMQEPYGSKILQESLKTEPIFISDKLVLHRLNRVLDLNTGQLVVLSESGAEAVYTDNEEVTLEKSAYILNGYTLQNKVLGRSFSLTIQGEVRSVFFSDNSTRVAVLVDTDEDSNWVGDLHLLIWNTDSGEMGVDIDGVDEFDSKFYFSPDDTLIAARNEDNTNIVRVWEVETGKVLADLESSPQPPKNYLPYGIFNIVFHPTEHWIATASDDQNVILWDINSGKPVWRHQVTVLGYSSDYLQFNEAGIELRFANVWGDIWIWDAETGTQLYHNQLQTDEQTPISFYTVEVFEDRTLVLWYQQSDQFPYSYIEIWDGQQLGRFDFPLSLSSGRPVFNHDRTLIATSGDDGVIRLWGVPVKAR